MTKKLEARPGSLDSSHDATVTWLYVAPAGHTLEDCQRPDYWGNVRREAGLQRVVGRHAWNKIEIVAEDGTWEAMLRVVSVSQDGQVMTRLLSSWTDPKKAQADAPEGYTVEHIAGNGWRALDPKQAPLTEKKASRDEALLAAVEHHRRAKDRR